MFESIAATPASRRRKIFFAVSGVAHGAALVGLIAVTMWRIDKIEFTREAPQITVLPPMPSNSGGGAPRKLPAASKPTVIKHPAHGPRQPTHVQITQETTTTTQETDGPPGDGGGGDGKGHDQPEIGGGCEGVNCGIAEIDVPAIKPCSDPSRVHDADCAPVKPPPVDDVVVEKLRTSGETQIQPPDDVKVMMAREGTSRLHAAFKVCLDEHGAVTSTKRIAGTGYDVYDDLLAGAMAGWHYRPYTVGGIPQAVCGAVTFNFTLRR